MKPAGIFNERVASELKRQLAELKENGVTANIIQVRAIDVEKTGKGTTPEEIVAAMLYLFSEEAAKVNGARIPLY